MLLCAEGLTQQDYTVKVEQVFSSTHYPIYYAYADHSLTTLLTKVVTFTDDELARTVKHHIQQHVLPYLARLHPAHSLLAIPTNLAEVVAKGKRDTSA